MSCALTAISNRGLPPLKNTSALIMCYSKCNSTVIICLKNEKIGKWSTLCRVILTIFLFFFYSILKAQVYTLWYVDQKILSIHFDGMRFYSKWVIPTHVRNTILVKKERKTSNQERSKVIFHKSNTWTLGHFHIRMEMGNTEKTIASRCRCMIIYIAA